jgi:tetratricopeptide (TPR) repeat protein
MHPTNTCATTATRSLIATMPRVTAKSTRPARTAPKGPFGQLVYDALLRRNLKYDEAVKLINDAAHSDGEKNVRYKRWTLTHWLTGTVPHPRTQRWIGQALGISVQQLAEAGEATKSARLQLELSPTRATVAPVHGSLDSWLSTSSHTADFVAASQWPVWFGIRLAHLIALVDNWQGPIAHADVLQALLHQEILMFDAVDIEGHDPAHTLSRRQALVTLATLPVAVAISGAGTLGAAAAADFFLSRCAASLTACWHLLRGSDLSTVDQMLSAYLVSLEGLAQRRSVHQQAAARLASQAHRICGIVALHRNQLKVREHHCQQALYYASVASDLSGQVSALISLASTYFYSNDPTQAAAVYERALAHEATTLPLQRSRVYAELSVVYGQLRREQDALRAIDRAAQLYPDDPEQDPSFLYAEFTPASLTLELGLAYIALAEQFPTRGYQRTAGDTFERMERTAPTAVPERIRFEIVNHQAATAVLLNDLDAFEAYITRAVDGATVLRSKQRQKEMLAVWQQAVAAWPRERRMKALGARLQSGSQETSA